MTPDSRQGENNIFNFDSQRGSTVDFGGCNFGVRGILTPRPVSHIRSKCAQKAHKIYGR